MANTLRGAARRRRERRFRAYLRFARMSVAMALTEARHHTAPRGQTTARAEATNDAPRSQTMSVAGIPSSSRCTRKNSGVRGLTGSTRPRRRNGFSGATVEQNDNSLSLPTLDVLVPQMENQLVEVCRLFDLHSRAGYRSAQDLVFPSFSQAPCAFC